jgi:hypothetical protein
VTGPKILVKDDQKARSILPPSPESGWALLGGIGLLFVLVAGVDLALAWYPVNFGNAEWEFGTVSTTLENLPLLALGLALAFGAAVARGIRTSIRAYAIIFVLLALVLIGADLLYLKNIGVAQKSVTDPVLRSGLDRAIFKSVAQAIVYPIAFLWIGIKGFRISSVA